MSVTVSISSLADMVNDVLGPIIYNANIFGGELGGVLFVGLLTCIFAFLSALVLIYIESYSNKVD